MRYFVAVSLLACAAAAAHAQSGDAVSSQQAIDELDACIERLDPALDVGYARVVVHCPGLARVLERSGWAEWLPRGWKEARNDLSAGSLSELQALIEQELEAQPLARAPNVERLKEVLAGLGPATQERASLWSRFRAWMRKVMERNRETDHRSWLDKMIQHSGRSQTFIEMLTYTSLGVLIILAGVIVVNELRAAGLLKSRARALAQSSTAAQAAPRRLAWADVEQAGAVDKPRLVLELVLSKLVEQKRMPPAASLTVRELSSAAELGDERDRAHLVEIATAAERARYSAQALPSVAIDQAVIRGRELLERLGALA